MVERFLDFILSFRPRRSLDCGEGAISDCLGTGLLTEGAWRNAFRQAGLSTVKPAIIRLESSAH